MTLLFARHSVPPGLADSAMALSIAGRISHKTNRTYMRFMKSPSVDGHQDIVNLNKIKRAPLTQHDLDHHRLRIQVLALQQIVLRLLVQRSFEEVDGDPKETRELAPVRLREALQGLEREPGTSEWHPAEAATFDDEHREVLADLHKHLEVVLADLLPTEED